jgi:hypothetical protein
MSTKTSTKSTKAKPVQVTWPKITGGSHLTVTEHENGKTELKWDDEQLLKDVREATKQPTKGTKNGKTKKTSKSK